jgi:hypothetical protein
MAMKKLLLAGIAAPFLATGVAYTQEADIHHGDNVVLLFLEKADGRYFGDGRSTLESWKGNLD